MVQVLPLCEEGLAALDMGPKQSAALLPVACRVQIEELGVAATGGYQRLLRALLDEAAVL